MVLHDIPQVFHGIDLPLFFGCLISSLSVMLGSSLSDPLRDGKNKGGHTTFAFPPAPMPPLSSHVSLSNRTSFGSGVEIDPK